MIRVCMLRWLYHAQKSSEPSTENQQTPTSMSSGVTTTTATWVVMVVSHLDVLPHSAVTCLHGHVSDLCTTCTTKTL